MTEKNFDNQIDLTHSQKVYSNKNDPLFQNLEYSDRELSFQEPEKIEIEKSATSSKLKEFSRSRYQNLAKLDDNIAAAQIDYIIREREFLTEAGVKATTFIERTQEQMKFRQADIEKLQSMTDQINVEKPKYQQGIDQAKKDVDSINNGITKYKSAIHVLNEKKKEIADRIDPTILAKSKLTEEKNGIYTLFLWCMCIVYGETEAKFFWENFKKQALVNDKGIDFKNRLKGLKSILITEHLNLTDRVLKAKPEIENFMKTTCKSSAPAIVGVLEYIENLKEINVQHASVKELEMKLEEAQINLDIKQSEFETYNTQVVGYQSRLAMLNQYETCLSNLTNNFNKIHELTQQRIPSQALLAENIKENQIVVAAEVEEPIQKQSTIQNIDNAVEINQEVVVVEDQEIVLEQQDKMEGEIKGKSDENKAEMKNSDSIY